MLSTICVPLSVTNCSLAGVLCELPLKSGRREGRWRASQWPMLSHQSSRLHTRQSNNSEYHKISIKIFSNLFLERFAK